MESDFIFKKSNLFIGRMKGALPVPYIVALVIAIIVIAVLVYWFVVLRGQGTSAVTLALCQGKLVNYCSQWSRCNYETSCQPSSKGNPVSFYEFASECSQFAGQPDGLPASITDRECKQTLGQRT